MFSATRGINLSRNPTDRELATIAKTLGNGWEMLAAFLSIDQPKVERIKLEFPHSTASQVLQLLLAWRGIKGFAASFEELLKSIEECGSVSVDWDMLETTLGSRFGMFFVLKNYIFGLFYVYAISLRQA